MGMTSTVDISGIRVHSRPMVARQVEATPTVVTRQGAQACLVHLHGDEENSRVVAETLRSQFCVNFVDLPTTTRNVGIRLPSGRRCEFDPNRVFTDSGRRRNAFHGGCPDPDAVPELERWVTTQLVPAISRCRGGGGGSLTGGTLPVVAFHNNTPRPHPRGLSILQYRPGGTEAAATETDADAQPGAERVPVDAQGNRVNPVVQPGVSPHDYVLVTRPNRFTALRGSQNVVLQENVIAPGSRADDGSLSVAMAGVDYTNIEAGEKRFTDRGSRFYVQNEAMGRAVLTAMGLRPGQCHGEAPQRPLGSPPSFFDSVARALDRMETLRQAMPREAPPATLPPGCVTFPDQAALDTRRNDIATRADRLAGMALADIVRWVIGKAPPPSWVTAEVGRQRAGLFAALRAAAARPGSPIHLDRRLPHVIGSGGTGHRDFAQQNTIWRRKFQFSRAAGRFGRITDDARRRCPSLGSAVEWNTGDRYHQVCWASLDADQRQWEILQTSSAPGISRHHWGTDLDIFSDQPARWAAGGPLADEHAWLVRNAATYGFIQPFTAASTVMRTGYTEERWHWSYYPVAQALVQFARGHVSELDAALRAEWSSGGTPQPEYSFISGHWQEFLFNVGQQGEF